jgi:predicted permease
MLTTMNNFLLSLHQVGPVFLIILVGVLLKRFRLISEEFSSTATAVVFRVGLPCLLFGTLMKTDFIGNFDPLPVLVAVAGTLVFFGLGWLTGSLMIRDHKPRGAFILGTYWSNCAIIGFAIIQNVLGDKGLVPTAFIVAFLVPLFNILAVTTLTVIDVKNRPFPVRKVLMMLATHPLIIAISIGLVFSLLRLKLPGIVAKPVDLLGQMTLPLALLAVGATLSFSNIRDNLRNSVVSSVFKTVLMPAFITLAAVLLGVRGDSLVVLFILTGTPAAVTSFIVATAMKSDSRLAANIVLVSTLMSILTLATGLFILRELRLM